MLEIGVERLVAENQARIEQCRADGHVGVAELHALVDGAGGVADLEAQIPQEIEHVLDDALAPGSLLVRQQEKQIDVGTRREQASAVAALGYHGHALRSRGIVAR